MKKTPAATKVTTSAPYKRNFIGIDHQHHTRTVQRSGTMRAGAIHTTKQAGNLPDSEVFSRPKFMVSGLGASTRKDGGTTCFVWIYPAPPNGLSSRCVGFQFNKERETMTTSIVASRCAAPASPHLDPIALHGEAVNAASMARWYAARHDYAAAFRRSAQATGALRKLAALERVEIAA